MPRFNPRDVQEILDMLEDGISSIPKLGKIEKMKMRSQIRRQGGWISVLGRPSGEMIYQRLEERLSDIFPLYPYDFKDRLKRLLQDKSKLVRSP
jgi:hypothetical protein